VKGTGRGRGVLIGKLPPPIELTCDVSGLEMTSGPATLTLCGRVTARGQLESTDLNPRWRIANRHVQSGDGAPSKTTRRFARVTAGQILYGPAPARQRSPETP